MRRPPAAATRSPSRHARLAHDEPARARPACHRRPSPGPRHEAHGGRAWPAAGAARRSRPRSRLPRPLWLRFLRRLSRRLPRGRFLRLRPRRLARHQAAVPAPAAAEARVPPPAALSPRRAPTLLCARGAAGKVAPDPFAVRPVKQSFAEGGDELQIGVIVHTRSPPPSKGWPMGSSRRWSSAWPAWLPRSPCEGETSPGPGRFRR